MMDNRGTKFDVAPLSFGVVLIPDDPIYSEVSNASLAITKLCDNRNIIDNDKFPCHLSVILSGTSQSGISFLREELSKPPGLKKVQSEASRVYTGDRGFIGVGIQEAACRDLHDVVLQSMKLLIAREPMIRPHLKQRWPRLTPSERALLTEYGSYHVGKGFHPHLSVAQVDDDDALNMAKVAKTIIHVPQNVTFSVLQLVDVGHRNEKWEVLESLPLR